MIHGLIKSTIALSLAASVAFSAPALRFNAVPGDQEDKYEELLAQLEEATGFSMSDPHEKINDAYKERYGNPEDPDTPELMAKMRKFRDTYLQGGRDEIGWAIYMFLKEPFQPAA